jgi:hypothetical protein
MTKTRHVAGNASSKTATDFQKLHLRTTTTQTPRFFSQNEHKYKKHPESNAMIQCAVLSFSAPSFC